MFWGVMLWVGGCVWLLHSHRRCCGTGGGAALLQHPRMNLLKDKLDLVLRALNLGLLGSWDELVNLQSALPLEKHWCGGMEMQPWSMFVSSKWCTGNVTS